MNDEQILDLYFARDEQAVAETDRKYGGYCFTLANSILHSDQDAEETVSDTYLRAWNTIPPKRPGILPSRPSVRASSKCSSPKSPGTSPFPAGGA